MTKHPYYLTAKDEQRDAFREEVRRMIEKPAPSWPTSRRTLEVKHAA